MAERFVGSEFTAKGRLLIERDVEAGNPFHIIISPAKKTPKGGHTFSVYVIEKETVILEVSLLQLQILNEVLQGASNYGQIASSLGKAVGNVESVSHAMMGRNTSRDGRIPTMEELCATAKRAGLIRDGAAGKKTIRDLLRFSKTLNRLSPTISFDLLSIIDKHRRLTR